VDKWIPGCPLDRSGKFRKPAEVKPSWPNWQRNIQEMGSWWCNRLSYPNMVIIGQAMPPIYNWQSSWKNETVGNLSNFEALNSKHRTTWSVFKDRFMSQLFQQAWRIYSWTPSLGQGFVRWKGIPFRFRTLWPIFPGRWSHPQRDKDLNSGGMGLRLMLVQKYLEQPIGSHAIWNSQKSLTVTKTKLDGLSSFWRPTTCNEADTIWYLKTGQVTCFPLMSSIEKSGHFQQFLGGQAQNPCGLSSLPFRTN
jgi:hypothetical protein